MVEAGPAAPGKLTAQRLAGAMQADARVSRCDPRLRGEGAHTEAVEIDAAKCRAILGLERAYQSHDAGTHYGLELLVGWGRLILGLCGEPKKRPAPGSFTAVMVDDGVPEHPVEPGRGRLGALQSVRPANAADERLLQDVLGLVAGPHSALQEANEAGVVVNQQAEHLGNMRVALGELGCGGLEREAHWSVGYVACRRWSSAIAGRSRWQHTYSHPHPQVQGASAQGQSGPQVQVQPQEQPWVFRVVSVIGVLRFGAGCPAWLIVAFTPANARLREPLHLPRRSLKADAHRPDASGMSYQRAGLDGRGGNVLVFY